MELGKAGLSTQPFRTHGAPLTVVRHRALSDALAFLQSTRESPHGLGLLQGPSLSGKSTIIHEFVRSLNDDVESAIVDGRGLDARRFLERVLKAFDFDVELDSVNELFNMLRVYVMQQVALHSAPLIVVENTHALHPDALQYLCELAELRSRSKSAVRIVLTSDQSLQPMLAAPAMACIARRVTGTFNLAPMSEDETGVYLYCKLRAGGCDKPEAIVPETLCGELHRASGGWPGIVDRLMLLALARAESCPLAPDLIERPVVPGATGAPGLQSVTDSDDDGNTARLYLTHNGRTLREIPLRRARVMIGRSEHNDIAVASRFISRHHALFIREGNTTLLMDLNSTNGTFVNSRRVSNHIMVNDDIVTVGHHGLKFVDPSATGQQSIDRADMSDTIIMKSIDDMRRLLARENTQALEFDDDAVAE